MIKSLIVVVGIACATMGGICSVRKSTPNYPDYSALALQLYAPTPAARRSAVMEIYSKSTLAGTP